jgi:dephospho-CoA kinase
MLKEIAITGGIGSGKTFVCAIFKKLGVPVYYADSEAKNLVNEDVELKNKIQFLLGKESYVGGVYDTKFVAKKVFGNVDLLKKINAIIHPAVAKDYRKWVKKHNADTYILKESALIFELGMQNLFYKTILVTADENLRMKRLVKRDSWRNKSEVEAIFDKQLSDKEKIPKADFILSTNETELLLPQVIKIHEELINN